MTTAFDPGGTRDRLHSTTRQGQPTAFHRSAIAWIAAGMLATAAMWWVAAPKAPSSHVPQSPGRRMHVADIEPTDATFQQPQRAFTSGWAYWRVRIVDADGGPVAHAHVRLDLIGPDRAVGAQLVATTTDEGRAFFSYGLGHPPLSGVYTVRIVDVWHPDPAAIYDRAANGAWANSFSVAARPPRPTTPLH